MATAVAAVFVVSGCGKETASQTRTPEEQAAGRAAQAYLVSMGQGRYSAACRRLSAQARDDIARYVRSALPDLASGGCPAILRSALAMATPAALTALRGAEVRGVRVAGSTASVRFVGRSDSVPMLRSESGRWQVASLTFSMG